MPCPIVPHIQLCFARLLTPSLLMSQILRRTSATTWVGLACMLMLNGFAFHLYMERANYLDLSFHSFTYLKTHALFIQNKRFVAAITQWVPLLAIRNQASIGTTLRLYSIAFTAYYTLVFGLCAWPLRQPRIALVVPLLFTLLVTDAFYWAQSELPQTLALLVLYYGIVAGEGKGNILRWLIGICLIPVVIYGHPLAIIPFVFIWGYEGLLRSRLRHWQYYIPLVLAAACYWLRQHSIEAGSYEDLRIDVMASLKRFFPLNHNFHRFRNLTSNKDLLRLSLGPHAALPIVLVALGWFYLRRGSWGRLLWVLAFVIGYSQLISISYPNGVADLFYLENLYLPLGLFLAVPLALELLPAIPRPGWAALSLAALFGIRLAAIWHSHLYVTEYQEWLTRVLHYGRESNKNKLVMARGNAINHFPTLSWATGYESILRSARPAADSACTLLITSREKDMQWQLGQQESMLTELEQIPYADLDSQYFRLPRLPYHHVNTPPPTAEAELRAYLTAMAAVKLQVAPLAGPLSAGAPAQVMVRISNPTGQLVHSGLDAPHPTQLAYRFIDNEGWYPDPIRCANPLEVDVVSSWQQPMRLLAPKQPGRYSLEIYLTSEGLADWPVRTQVEAIVE